jgi:hypothetical protein
MCLIAYVPKGKTLERDVFDNAARVNPDGIGVMSAKGIEKFFGQKQTKRARQYVAGLVKEGLAHAVHWRFATHGTKQIALCHPFKLPHAEAWIMHNGVIGATAQEANDDASDTLLWVNKLIDAPTTHESLPYWSKVANDIGRGNKGLVMYPNGHFVFLNHDDGVTIEDIWYSNSYSLPVRMRPTTSYFVPARLRPASQWTGNRGGYYGGTGMHNPSGYFPTSTPSSNYGGPYGAMIYWSTQMGAYGFWEGGMFRKLKVEAGETVFAQPHLPPTTTINLTADDAERKCPRCMRFKSNPPAGFLICWCTDDALKDYYVKQQAKVDAAKATEKPAGPSGPTL